MLRVVLTIIRLYFLIGIVLGLILFGSAMYHYFALSGQTAPFGEVFGRALLAAVFRVFLWGPELWQFGRTQPFLDWLLAVPRPSG